MDASDEENVNPNRAVLDVSISKKTGKYINHGFMLRLHENAQEIVTKRKRKGGFKQLRSKKNRKKRKTHRGFVYTKKNQNLLLLQNHQILLQILPP